MKTRRHKGMSNKAWAAGVLMVAAVIVTWTVIVAEIAQWLGILG
jgi:hypothetical protein